MYDYGYKKLTIEEAEKHIGGRLDRRRKYFLWDFHDDGNPVVCHDFKYLHHCTGCLEMGDYGSILSSGGFDPKRRIEVGAGCQECGYTGVRWSRHIVPVQTI